MKRTMRTVIALVLTSTTIGSSLATACPRGKSVVMNQAVYHSAVRNVPIPAPAPPPLESVRSGSLLEISGSFLGDDEGVAKVWIGHVAFEAEVRSWTAEAVVVRLPQVSLGQPTEARIDLHRPDGKLARSGKLRILPRPAFKEIDSDESIARSRAVGHTLAAKVSDDQQAERVLPSVKPGTMLRIRGEFFGKTAGAAVLTVGEFSVEATVRSWASNQIVVTLPDVQLRGTADATLELFKEDGSVAKKVEFRLMPPEDFDGVNPADVETLAAE